MRKSLIAGVGSVHNTEQILEFAHSGIPIARKTLFPMLIMYHPLPVHLKHAWTLSARIEISVLQYLQPADRYPHPKSHLSSRSI